MLRRIGFVFAIFLGLVFLNYIATLFLGAVASAGPSLFPASIGGPLGSSGPTSGLATVDLSQFGPGEPGRDYITQGYGRTAFSYLYVNHVHDGIDIAARYGAPILSPGDGVVLATGNQDKFCPARGFGKYVAVYDEPNGIVLWYAHLGTIKVSPGEKVTKGEEIGAVGTTGFETGPHLHFSVFKGAGFNMLPKNGCGPDPGGTDANPLDYLGTVYN